MDDTTVLAALDTVPDNNDPPPAKKRPAEAAKKCGPPALKKPRAQQREEKLRTRWPAERYEAAEAMLVGIMRKMGAGVGGTPVARQAVRDEARKHIGDTGLLDHLLKHMVGKTVAGGTDRLCRQHDPDGVMQYWLEPAEFADIRREAGVTDPYWVPPPGWKLGELILPQCPCDGEEEEDWENKARKLGEEVAGMKREFHELLEWKRTTEKEMAGMSNRLQALKQEVRSVKEEKQKKLMFAGLSCALLSSLVLVFCTCKLFKIQ